MKKFSKYIQEKLIINKNFKNSDYDCSEPNDEGTCLTLCFSTASNKASHRIDISMQTYRYIHGNTEYIKGGGGYIYIRNENGYFCIVTSGYILVMLFDEDAKHFFDILLEDPERTFDANDFSSLFNDIDEDFAWPYQVKDRPVGEEERCYGKKEIENFMNELK